MPYTTRQDLERRFGVSEITQLVDAEPDGSPPATLRAIAEDVDAIVNGYLSGVYALPLCAPVPPLVLGIAADICRYRLWDDRAPKEVRQRYEDAMAMLKDIAKGAIKLPAAPNVVPAAEYGGIIATTTRERTFTDDTLGGFVGRGDLRWPPTTD